MSVQHRVNNNILYKNYNIFYFNINSLLNKLEDVYLAIERCSQTVHFIVLTEVRLFTNENVDYNLPNYNVFFHNSPDRYGGVALYVHRSISCTKTYSRFNNNVNLLLVKTNVRLYIGIIYKAPNVDRETFYRIFKGFLERCNNNRLGTLIIGDFNIDLLKTEGVYRDIIDEHGYTILNKININHATRVSDRSATIIDHVITNIGDADFSISLRDINFSDHRQMIIGFN